MKSAKNKSSTSTQALQLVSKLPLWITPRGESYATISKGKHVDVRSEEFRQHLAIKYRQQNGAYPTGNTLDHAVMEASARAKSSGKIEEVYLRHAFHRGAIYFDLGGPNGSCVKIENGTWSIITSPPVKFRQTKTMKAMPTPVTGGNIDTLKKYLNVESDDDFRLVCGWLLGAFMPPIGGYPIFAITGEQGSAKSTTAHILKRLTDWDETGARQPTSNIRDLAAAVHNGRIISFDNVSSIPQGLSDTFCRISTGINLSARALYTDNSETTVHAHAPIILNGIPEFVRRGDLLDRCISIHLPRISQQRRRDERTFWADFERDEPAILGALFDAVATALHQQDNVKLEVLPRMADWAKWCTAGEAAFGWESGTILAAYESQRHNATVDSLSDDPLVTLLTKVVDSGGYSGTSSDLLNRLENLAVADTALLHAVPNSPKDLTGRLQRLAPQLPTVGIGYTTQRKPDKRLVVISRLVNTSVA